MANAGPNTNGQYICLDVFFARDCRVNCGLRFQNRFANCGPVCIGSQFFLTLAPTPFLDGKHTIFGRVSSGMPTLQRLAAVRTDGNDR